MVVGLALFFFVLGGSVVLQTQRMEAQHRIDSLDSRLSAAQELNRRLHAEVAVAESPDQITNAAVELDMIALGPVVPLVPDVVETPADDGPSNRG